MAAVDVITAAGVESKGIGLLIFIIGILVSLAVEGLTGYGLTWFRESRPATKLWRIHDPKSVVVVASTAGELLGGNNVLKPTTGVGQVRAVGWITQSLSKAYKEFDLDHVRLSDESIGHVADRDLVLIGGRRTNSLTRQVREMLEKNWEGIPRIEIVRDSGVDKAEVRAPIGPSHASYRVFRPSYESGPGDDETNEVVVDIGVIFRAPNPLNESNTVVILAGTHSEGTEGAAKYFVSELGSDHLLRDAEAFCCVIEVGVVAGTPKPTRVLYQQVLQRKDREGSQG